MISGNECTKNKYTNIFCHQILATEQNTIPERPAKQLDPPQKIKPLFGEPQTIGSNQFKLHQTKYTPK